MNEAGDGSVISGERGQSALIGFVILIGLVAVASAGVLLVGGDLLTATEQQAEEERVLQAFTELGQEMQTISTNNDVSRSINLDAGEHGAVVKTDTGTLRISGGDVDEEIEIGAIEYQGDDGTRVAYQGGAVFHETGEETQIVSSPPIYFDPKAESLSFPVIKAKDEADLSSGDITVRHSQTDPLTDANLVRDDTVTVEITSEYYRGWETYFEQQGGPTTVKDVKVNEGSESGTVTVEFGYQEISDAFRTNAIYANEFKTQGGVEIDEDDAEEAAYPELDEEIERVVNQTKDENSELDGEPVTHLGTVDEHESGLSDPVYFADGIHEDGHLEFDLTEGSTTLVVDGDIYADGKTITVSDYEDGNQLKVYVTGDYNAENGGDTCVTVEGCDENEDATVIQLAVTSESKLDFGSGGKARYEGVIYAGGTKGEWEKRRSCSAQACFHSNPSFYGSIVASSIDIQGGEGGLGFEYDEKLQDADLEIYPDPSLLPPQLTYLNIAEHQIEIEEN